MRDEIKQQHTVNDKQIETLKREFPECFDRDGKFISDKFNQIVTSSGTEITKEWFNLNWLGKSYAKLLANASVKTILSEDKEHNSEPQNQNSQNLLIKGDNLEVLKHLTNAYSNKIKMIYIDPPYNTGSDEFVYEDEYNFTKEQLAELANISIDEAHTILEFTKRKSNSHSAWLTFMYPRLYIAKSLLKDDGVIFISIDDNEQAQLKLLCDEVFGEGNFVNSIIWGYKTGGIPETGKLAKKHDTILFYAKYLGSHTFNIMTQKSYVASVPEPHTDSGRKLGVCRDEICDICGNTPGQKYRNVIMRDVWDDIDTVFRNIRNGIPFPSQKPSPLIIRMMQLVTNNNDNDIILDFFAGSGTTGDAVMHETAPPPGGEKVYISAVTTTNRCKETTRSI
jgi:adenine specific DNA methylase Mod